MGWWVGGGGDDDGDGMEGVGLGAMSIVQMMSRPVGRYVWVAREPVLPDGHAVAAATADG